MDITFPVTIALGSAVIPVHLLTDLIAYFVGIEYYLRARRKKRDSISDEQRLWLIGGAAVGAALGAHVLGLLEDPAQLLTAHPLAFYMSNKTIVGGLLGGLIGVEITKKLLRIRTRTGDAFVYPLLLGIGIGRIGCFLTGVSDNTVGNPSSLPWAFDQGDGIPRHPTALYEIAFLLVLFIALRTLEKRVTLKQGALFQLFMLSYLVYRFLVEFIKPGIAIVFGVSAIQLACAAAIVYYGYTLRREGVRG